LLAAACVALGATGAALFPLRAVLARGRVLDTPNARSSHTLPTPRGGGLAPAVAALAAWVFYVVVAGQASLTAVSAYVAGALLVAGVGFLDDLFSLRSSVRFAVQSVAALLAVGAFGSCQALEVPLLGTVSLGWLGLPLTLLGIVYLINAYNFMDGIDGIAGGQGLVAGLGWAFLGVAWAEPAVSALGLCVAAACLGFLGHNWSPARIFMGDVGSTFLGYTFACLPLMATSLGPADGAAGRAFVAGILPLWPFLFDSGFTLLRRLSKGENIFAAHRSHLYQRLTITGHSHRLVSSLYAVLAALGVALALGWVYAEPWSDAAVAVGLPLGCLALWAYVVSHERRAATPASEPVAVRGAV
jgi:UDP-N-acetylmuramyl pentapeptide phosphotransferase/UDP-N-acetylglucosamine-1-phosphate transferase